MTNLELIGQLAASHTLPRRELLQMLDSMTPEERNSLLRASHETRLAHFGDRVYMRGLLEFTNHCVRDCLYCGIRASNQNVERYRLTEDQIVEACHTGRRLGYKTYVLQGGEDPWFTEERVSDMVRRIKQEIPGCAITLSIGEKSRETYQAWFDAGADRYLLRHETASPRLYAALHPASMSLENRQQCLRNLKEIGYQVGAGFMVGLPGQTNEDLLEDLMFLKELEPHMVGIGPFIPHHDTPLAGESGGELDQTVTLLAILRLLLPDALLPATTALGSIDPLGREAGIKAGANVVMPNLTPTSVRPQYLLYDGKICTGDEAAECRMCIERRINRAGFSVDMSVGDHPSRMQTGK